MNKDQATKQENNRSQKPAASQQVPALAQLDDALPSLVQARPLPDLPTHPSSRLLRQAAVLQMQRRNGNLSTRQSIARTAVSRQDEEESDNVPLPVAGMGHEEELSGHGNQLLIQRQNGGAAAASPTATITLNVNPANIVRAPEATISANHGRAGVAGWCTPRYDVQPTARTAVSLNLTVTLDFTIELASEYNGGRLSVLSDHENGHIIIGERLAQQHLVNGLKSSLEALPNFRSAPPIQAAIAAAARSFVSDEGQQSRAYDSSDYGRMREAYYGVRTPLADLAAASPAIQGMAAALRAFNSYASGIQSSEPENPVLTGLASDAIDARTALSETDVARLQYNPEFKNIVYASQDLAGIVVDSVSENERVYIEELMLVITSFHWNPSV